MAFRLLNLFLMIMIAQAATKDQFIPVEFENSTLAVEQILERLENTGEGQSDNDKEETESKTLEKEGLIDLDLFRIYRTDIILKLPAYKNKQLCFFKPKLNTPPPEFN